MSQTIDRNKKRRPDRPGSGKEITLKTGRKQRIYPNSPKKPRQAGIRASVHRCSEIICGDDHEPYESEDKGGQSAIQKALDIAIMRVKGRDRPSLGDIGL